jgi:alanine racemase
MTSATATINLLRLRRNARQLVRKADTARVVAVVKADAYGHGALQVAATLQEEGIDFFAVATVEEGIQLREHDVRDRVLVMGAYLPGSAPAYRKYGLEATIGSLEGLEAAASESQGSPFAVHLKIDTGMGRIGLPPDLTAEAMRRLRAADSVRVVGLSTHLASADDDDLTFAETQLARFRNAIEGIDLEGLNIHIANTEGLARLPEAYLPFERSMVRVGIGLYGCPNREDTRRRLGVEPVMTVAALVTNVKRVEAGTPISYNGRWTADTRTHIATVGIGYADGYRRILRGRAEVGVAAERRPVVGTICMDMVMVDLGPDAPEVAVGEEVVIFGEGGPDVSEVAAWSETICYEVTSGVGSRVRRLYR